MKDLKSLEALPQSPIRDFLIQLINHCPSLEDADCSNNDDLLSYIECSTDYLDYNPESFDRIAERKLINMPIECPYSYNEIIGFMKDNQLLP